MYFVRLLPYVFMMLFVAAPVYAQYITGLEIEALFRKSEKLYTQVHPDMDAILEQTARHMMESAIIKQETTSNKGPRIISEFFTREDVLKNIRENPRNIFDTMLKRTITNIEYSKDRMEATVEYTAFFKAIINLSDEAKKQPEYLGMDVLPFKSLSVCTEKFKLIDDILKSFGSDCKIEILYGKARAIK